MGECKINLSFCILLILALLASCSGYSTEKNVKDNENNQNNEKTYIYIVNPLTGKIVRIKPGHSDESINEYNNDNNTYSQHEFKVK